MVGRDQVGEGGKLLINGRMIEELVGGDKIMRKSTSKGGKSIGKWKQRSV